MTLSDDELIRLYDNLGRADKLDEKAAAFRRIFKVHVDRIQRRASLQTLHERAMSTANSEFADRLRAIAEDFRDQSNLIAAEYIREPPKGSELRVVADRVSRAAREFLKVMEDSRPVLQSKLADGLLAVRAEFILGDVPGDRLDLLELEVALLNVAADRIAQSALPRVRSAPSRVMKRDQRREQFLQTLKRLFKAHGVPWSSTADEYTNTSLAVDAVCAALDLRPTAASKAILRIDKIGD
jgi:hypothetical protein